MDEINSLLRSYNSTPHSSTGIPPVDLMFGRANANTSLLPIWPSTHSSVQLESAILSDRKAKASQKAHYDARTQAKKRSFSVGDQVMLDTRYDAKIYNKTTPRFDPDPYISQRTPTNRQTR